VDRAVDAAGTAAGRDRRDEIRALPAKAAVVCATSGTPPDLANIRLLS
jgi:hypothetical protein